VEFLAVLAGGFVAALRAGDFGGFTDPELGDPGEDF
jgi:hypothetical protein